MNKGILLNEIMRDYDKDRQAAERLKTVRLSEVYSAVPRVAEIDAYLAGASIEISKAILAKTDAPVKKLMEESKKLQAEKKALIKESGFKSSYLEDVYKCSKCKDTGYIENERCSCLNQRIISKYYAMSNLGRILEKENFDNFDLRYYSDEVIVDEGISPKEKMKLIYRLCTKFVSEFSKKPSNLLFYGKPGLGKTFMCNCIAKDLLDTGHTVLYAAAGKLFKTIEDARFNRSEMTSPAEQLDFFYTAELLIIDDLGTEFSTLATQSALFDIINSRILDSRPTVISSNLSPRDMEQQYSDRLVSRLQGHYTFCKFLGDDIRQVKKYSFKQKK